MIFTINESSGKYFLKCKASMEKPESNNPNWFAHEVYETHLASLPTYALESLPTEWTGLREVEMGVHFKLEKRSWFYSGNYMSTCIVCKEVYSNSDKLWMICQKCCDEIIAVPVAQQSVKGSDRKFAVVYNDFTYLTENEDMIEQYKKAKNFLAVLPYDFYWNFEKDEFTTKHNERMWDKVNAWIDGYKAASTPPSAKDSEDLWEEVNTVLYNSLANGVAAGTITAFLKSKYKIERL